MKRVCIIGTSGAGKTTLGRALSERLDVPFVDSDSYYWEEGWRPATPAALKERILAATSGDAWVFDGNFLSLRRFVWPRADTIVWLDFSLAVVMARICRRNALRIIGRERLWNGNREHFGRAWSGVRHTWATHRSKQPHYHQFLAEFPQQCVVHLRSPLQAKHWMAMNMPE